jgi:hypothetical protein
MSDYKLEYLQMKEKYLALKNELGLYDDVEGAGIMGKLSRRATGVLAGPLAEAAKHYDQVFKTSKISGETQTRTAKIHNNLKIRYFDAKEEINRFEAFVNGFPKPDPTMDDKDAIKCLTNPMKMFKAKFKKARDAYMICFMYPFERDVAKAVQTANVTEVSTSGSKFNQARKVLKDMLQWNNFSKSAINAEGKIQHWEEDNFYLWVELDKIQQHTRSFTTETQMSDPSEKAAYDARMSKKELKRTKSKSKRSLKDRARGLKSNLSIRNPLYRRGSKGGFSDSSDFDSSDYESYGGYSDGDEDYYVY